MADEMRVHCQQKKATFLIGTIKLAHENFGDTRRWGIGPKTGESVHRPIGCIILDPFYWQFDNTCCLTLFKDFIRVVICHQRTVIDQPHLAGDGHCVRAEIPRRRADTDWPYTGNFLKLVGRTHLQFAFIFWRKCTV